MTADELREILYRYLNTNCTQQDMHYMTSCALENFKWTQWVNRSLTVPDKPHIIADYVKELEEIYNQFVYELAEME